MKIIFAIKSMSSTRGGAERVLAEISSAFSEQGHNVTVLSFDDENSSSLYEINTKIKEISLGLGKTKAPSTLLETVRRMLALRKAVKHQSPDVVIAFMHSMFIPLSFSLIGTGIPVIASEHIVPEHYRTRKFQFLLLCMSSLFVKKITVLSESIKQTYPSFLQTKMVVFTNPVMQAKKLKTDYTNVINKRILTVGRLSEQKNHALLIDAFAKISDTYPDWSVKIIGEGGLRPMLQKKIEDYNLQDRIELGCATDKIQEEYLQADIFAMPSNYESFGLALVEAMGHGLPVLGFSDCQGVNELIKDKKNGLLIDSKNRVNSFSKGLETLIQSSELREQLGTEGIKTAQKFSPDKIGTVWEDKITDILKNIKN